jgi:hypothetical protein
MACLNCGSDRIDAYCSRCGQLVRRSRFALRPLLRQAADDALNLDHGLLHTVVALTVRPGRAVAEYVRGRTRPYTNPAKYLVICAALATFAMLYSGVLDAQLDAVEEQTRRRAEVPDTVVDERMNAMAEFMTRYFNIMLILGVPFLAVFSRLFFFRSAYNFAEHLIFNVFVYAHQNLFFLLAVPLIFVGMGLMFHTSLYMVLIVLYYIWACYDFFQVSLLTAIVRGVMITFFGYFITWAIVGLALSVLIRV